MAYGIELILGWNPDNFSQLPFAVPQKPDQYLDHWEDPFIFDTKSNTIVRDEETIDKFETGQHPNLIEMEIYDYFRKQGNLLRELLEKAHQEACKDMGFEFIRTKKESPCQIYSHIYNTPLGEKEFRPFVFELHYYPGSDMGDRYENALIGVGISGYKSVFADWESICSGIGEYQVYPPTKEMTIARDAIVRNIKWFETAKYYIKMVHY